MTNWPEILSTFRTIPPDILSLSLAAASIVSLLLLILILFRVFRRPRVAPETQTQLQNLNEKLDRTQSEASTAARSLREELMSSTRTLGSTLSETITLLSESESKVQQDRLDQITKQHESLRTTVETRLDTLRRDNDEKLEKIRSTVDEKLQSTLEQKLSEQHKLVSDTLEQVHKSVGEMTSLAGGIEDLKRLMANVRARGTVGEHLLGSLLEQILIPEQFETNVEVVPGSNKRVEYAVRLPGEGAEPIWLPLDSKFNRESYDRLKDAADRGDADAVEKEAKELEKQIRKAASDISEKYISPPHSTDFGVMFLPTEGLFAEVIRRPGLTDSLQHEYRVTVAGPTTLAALLSALQMGFRTLKIQKHSSEVWRVLGAVKTEFGKYADVMVSIKKRLRQASDEVDNVAVRQRQIDAKLKDVEALPEADARSFFTASVDLVNEAPRDDQTEMSVT
jgi:DNA recombination protein RmuC